MVTALIAVALAPVMAPVPSWKSLPIAKPAGEKQMQGCYTVANRREIPWKRPKFVYDAKAATGLKLAKVIVLIYNPTLAGQGGKTVVEHFKWNDPVQYSHILADVVRQASWGYINYEIVSILEVDGFPKRLDGTRYDEATYSACPSSRATRSTATKTGGST